MVFWEDKVPLCLVKGSYNKLVFVLANRPPAKRGSAAQPYSHGRPLRQTAPRLFIMYLEMFVVLKDFFFFGKALKGRKKKEMSSL